MISIAPSHKTELQHCLVTCTKLISTATKRKFGVWATHWGGNPSMMVQVDLIELGTGKISSMSYAELVKLIEEGKMGFE